jgi:hypothetical protein
MHWTTLSEVTVFSESVGDNAAGGTTPLSYITDLSSGSRRVPTR